MASSECKENVGKGIVSFPCTLPKDHEGPHYAVENQPSVSARAAWKKENTPLPHPGAESLGVFQGPPKTSQDGLMEPGAMTTRDTSEHGVGIVHRTKERPTFWSESQVKVRSEAPEAPVVPSVPTKQREGDQPLPTVHEGHESVQDLVIDDILERKQVGIQRYGTPLQTFNDRDVDLDLYEELLDATMYARQRLAERRLMLETLMDVISEIETRLGSLPITLEDNLAILYRGLYTV